MLSSADRVKLERLRGTFDRNYRVSRMWKTYLEHFPALITKEIMDAADGERRMQEEMYTALLAEAFGLSAQGEDGILRREYLRPAVRMLDTRRYTENPYYRRIAPPPGKRGRVELRWEVYPAYRAFVREDMVTREDLTEYAPLGFFGEDFRFPAVLENGNEWMTLTPVDLDTSEEAIAAARGRVVTFGLGLGYYAYMAARKPEVTEVTVVEKNPNVILLFREEILPRFSEEGEKIHIVEDDALRYAEEKMPRERFDVAFADTWRDASDGVPMYRALKARERRSEGTEFHYWIENFLISHLRSLTFEDIWQRKVLCRGTGVDGSLLAGQEIPDRYEDIRECLTAAGIRRLATAAESR